MLEDRCRRWWGNYKTHATGQKMEKESNTLSQHRLSPFHSFWCCFYTWPLIMRMICESWFWSTHYCFTLNDVTSVQCIWVVIMMSRVHLWHFLWNNCCTLYLDSFSLVFNIVNIRVIFLSVPIRKRRMITVFAPAWHKYHRKRRLTHCAILRWTHTNGTGRWVRKGEITVQDVKISWDWG